MTALTVAAHVRTAWNLPLAILMVCYLVMDSIWIALHPNVIGGVDGGGGNTLLVHHAAALLIAVHAATCVLHTPYTCWMSVVEANTLLLMLKKNWTGGPLVQTLLDWLFVASWVVTRLIWFPIIAVYFSIMHGYPSLIRRLVCSCMLAGLTVLQVLWTWNFCVPPARQIPLP